MKKVDSMKKQLAPVRSMVKLTVVAALISIVANTAFAKDPAETLDLSDRDLDIIAEDLVHTFDTTDSAAGEIANGAHEDGVEYCSSIDEPPFEETGDDAGALLPWQSSDKFCFPGAERDAENDATIKCRAKLKNNQAVARKVAGSCKTTSQGAFPPGGWCTVSCLFICEIPCP